MPPPATHLDPSELGTKSYWDSAYTTELSNFSCNAADKGTIWFADAGAEERMLAFLEGLEGSLEKGESGTRFLDVGTGNGHLLFALREDEWRGEMVGVDYSAQSVRLAREIRDSKGGECASIAFYEWDILGQPPGSWLGSGFDVVLDKGTFDAICLSQETDAEGRRICERYREKVEVLVKKGGRFLITSCNWTAEELRGWFEVEGGELVFEDQVRYPGFTFGGKTGTKVATLCFKRKE
ncbi:S-adenosyl-L-methionine-dependent methyltransferase [Massariosphaeria phaeospora]|uniref:Protein-lysine N-methyltransferase EFM4 n=1 Tax=Massariosphaeria phaeospora TaxID=100035 RepID=A0A7C8MFW6_9PLEO|nr:S-adenosyl-L-methionine-dependent methyltransferase [Massariosphaeria phaeospora]